MEVVKRRRGRYIRQDQEIPPRIIEAMSSFPQDHKGELFLLLTLRGYSMAAIARAYGQHDITVKKWLSMAKTKYPRCPE